MNSHGKFLATPSAEELRERWEKWFQAMELSNEMLMAGLRAQVGPDGDVYAAYRDWYRRYQDLKWKEPVIEQSQRRDDNAS
ncbi:MAG: hypothetical protein ABL921_24990 [Pirellula sp.]